MEKQVQDAATTIQNLEKQLQKAKETASRRSILLQRAWVTLVGIKYMSSDATASIHEASARAASALTRMKMGEADEDQRNLMVMLSQAIEALIDYGFNEGSALESSDCIDLLDTMGLIDRVVFDPENEEHQAVAMERSEPCHEIVSLNGLGQEIRVLGSDLRRKPFTPMEGDDDAE